MSCVLEIQGHGGFRAFVFALSAAACLERIGSWRFSMGLGSNFSVETAAVVKSAALLVAAVLHLSCGLLGSVLRPWEFHLSSPQY